MFLIHLLLTATLATYCIEPDQSQARISVDAAGFLSAFAHDHTIQTRAIRGCAEIDREDLSKSSIQVSFAAAGLKVLDPGESPKDRAEVQATMEEEVLRVRDFPEIRFTSQAVESVERVNRGYKFTVRGSLTLRDRTQIVSIRLEMEELQSGAFRVRGKHVLKQSAFGIKPTSLMGGLVKVKDEVGLSFDLLLSQKALTGL